MTLNLTDAEMNVLELLCEKKELSKTALIRQAIKLYQLVDDRMENGDKLIFENIQKKEKLELKVL
ncbi:transcriptional regulator [bacterium]|nr:transcriptional regulator [bacterium]MBP9806782.1 transcriptional regulator [bacterium]